MAAAFFSVASQLNLCFEGWPEPLLLRSSFFLQHFQKQEVQHPIFFRLEESLSPPASESFLLREGPLEVFREGHVLSLALPGILARVDAVKGDARLSLGSSWEASIENFVHLTLASLVCELGVASGLFAMHAAAIVQEGRVLLLPAASGSGKTTTTRNCHSQGMDVLADDLNWLQETDLGFRVWAFPRGGMMGDLPFPKQDGLPLGAILSPSIVAREESRLLPASVPEILPIVLQEGAFLSGQKLQARRFSALVRAARSVPVYRLEAGADYAHSVPSLLKEMGSKLSSR